MRKRCAVVLVLCVVVTAACGVGCSRRRQPRAMVEPAYSHLRQASAATEPSLEPVVVSLASARRHGLHGP